MVTDASIAGSDIRVEKPGKPHRRSVILVTGAPRTATTPVGNALALANRSCTIYEPLGPTGLRQFTTWFPMVDGTSGLDMAGLTKLVDDIGRFRGALKSQNRGPGPATLRTRLLGSRTLHSLRIARLRPWVRTVIWKDPHAVMLVPDLAMAGLPVVVTVRRARAHAASYKRLDWHSRAGEIYPRWRARYGADPVTEAWLDRVDEPVISAALIWRLSYLPLLRTDTLARVHVVTSEALERDEAGLYLSLYHALGLTPTPRLHKMLDRRVQAQGPAIPQTGATHDWSRSVTAVNAYWKDLLGADEVEAVDSLTQDVEAALLDHASNVASKAP